MTKIIMLVGHCGSGKTTAAEYIKNKLSNTVIIRGDKSMFDSIITYKSIFENIFETPVEVHSGHEYLIQIMNRGEMTVEKHRAFVTATVPFVENQIYSEIEEIKRNNSYDYIIVDWAVSSCFENLWDQADLRIMINSITEQRRDMLVNRINREGTARGAELFHESLKPLIDSAKKIDYTIINSYDEKFFDELNEIVNKVNTQNEQEERQLK